MKINVKRNIMFNAKRYVEFLKKAKYQYLLFSDDCTYYITLPSEPTNSDHRFLAHNETKGSVDLVHFKDIKKVIIDGKKYFF